MGSGEKMPDAFPYKHDRPAAADEAAAAGAAASNSGVGAPATSACCTSTARVFPCCTLGAGKMDSSSAKLSKFHSSMTSSRSCS
eukprot:6287863-Amphidinium_carterae.2